MVSHCSFSSTSRYFIPASASSQEHDAVRHHKSGRYCSGEELCANETYGPGKQEVEKTGI